MVKYCHHSWALVLVICPNPHTKCVFEVGGDIIKHVISFLVYLFKKLHKEKTIQLVKIEIVNSNVLIININED